MNINFYRSNDVAAQEWFKSQQAMMMMNPFGSQFNTGYMTQLYEVLMSSIGKTGTFANFRLNASVMDQIVKNHYMKEICIRDVSEKYLVQRAQLFKPIFYTSFNKTGI